MFAYILCHNALQLLAQLLVSPGSHSRCRNVPFCRPRLQQLFILLIELIPIQFYYFDKTSLTKIYVQNGDRIELSGDGQDPFGLRVKGSSLNKDLFKFRSRVFECDKTILRTESIYDNAVFKTINGINRATGRILSG